MNETAEGWSYDLPVLKLISKDLLVEDHPRFVLATIFDKKLAKAEAS